MKATLETVSATDGDYGNSALHVNVVLADGEPVGSVLEIFPRWKSAVEFADPLKAAEVLEESAARLRDFLRGRL